jgi:lysyl-tRNA synthetase, class II
MARLARTGELAAVALLSLLVVVAASGWLYLIEPQTRGWGGPLVDALPLDELAHHSSLPALVFVATWTVAGALLGLLARAARIERLTAGLVFALLTGTWLFASTGISILIVRQVPTGEAFRAPAHVSAVYLAAGLAGLSCAALARQATVTVRRRSPAILAFFVAASGVLDVASALTPEIGRRLQWVEDVTPNVVPRLADALVVPVGLALVALARGLYRRRRRAWQLTLVLVVVAAALHILKGLDYEEASANLLLAIMLVARRHDFAGRGDPRVRVHVLVRAAIFFGGIYAYAALALWINRIAIDRPYSLGFAITQTSRFLLGIDRGTAEHVSGQFGDWFPTSVFILGLAALFSLLWSWLAPWRHRLGQHAHQHQQAVELVARFGVDTLAPFSLRADKSYFFSQDERAFLAYRVHASIALISGDPVGPDDALEPLLNRFIGFAHDRGWRIAMLGASERHLPVYRRLGLHALYHGDEAVVDTTAFSLEGRSIRKVRQSVSRLEREGYHIRVLYPDEIDEELRAELEEIAVLWRGDAPERGFTMELDELFRLEGQDAVFVIGYAPGNEPRGFLHFAISHPSHTLSLSSMPRLRATPNGFNEWLVAETLNWARDHDYPHVSLNFAPFAALFGLDETQLTRTQRLQRRALDQLKGHFQLDNLLNFNRKFFPRWEKRFIIYERSTDLPRVGLAGLAAEGYLPFAPSRRPPHPAAHTLLPPPTGNPDN